MGRGRPPRRSASALVAFSLSRVFWLSAAILVPVGFAMMIEMGSSNTLIQSMVPDQLRGRVMSVYSMMFMGMAPIGSLLAGAAADHIGAPVDCGRSAASSAPWPPGSSRSGCPVFACMRAG